MPITVWGPRWETGLQSFMEEVERSFEGFFSRQTLPVKGQPWLPLVDVFETETDVVAVIDLPAVDAEALRVSVTGDLLTVEGERVSQETAGIEGHYLSERPSGFFQRAIKLPTEVEADEAKAGYQDGVLKVVIPKARLVVQKEIKIRVTGE